MNGQKLYAAMDKYDGMGVSFYFNAKDQSEANSKMIRWNRYHGFCDSPGWGWNEAVEVDEMPDGWETHNEYIR